MNQFFQEVVLWPLAALLQMFGIYWGRESQKGFWVRLVIGGISGAILIFPVVIAPKAIFFWSWVIGSVLCGLWSLVWGVVPDKLADQSLSFLDLLQDLLAGAMLVALAVALLKS